MLHIKTPEEHKFVQTSIGRLHAEVWRLGKLPESAGTAAMISELRDEIEGETRWVCIVEFLIRWQETRGQSGDLTGTGT